MLKVLLMVAGIRNALLLAMACFPKMRRDIKTASWVFSASRLRQHSEYLMPELWQSNPPPSFHVYPFDNDMGGSIRSRLMQPDKNSGSDNTSLLEHPSHFIMNRNGNRWKKKTSNIMCVFSTLSRDLEVFLFPGEEPTRSTLE